jgi:predicted transposase YbfD/YdcC
VTDGSNLDFYRKSNAIKAIPELLEMLAIKGAIVAIGARGTQKAIAAKITEKEAGYVLALKGQMSAVHDDVKRFFGDQNLRRSQGNRYRARPHRGTRRRIAAITAKRIG